jgi:hypothetical protein
MLRRAGDLAGVGLLVSDNNLAGLSARLLQHRERRQACIDALADAERNVELTEAELASAMASAGVRTYRHGGLTFAPRVRETWRLVRERRPDALALLKAHAPHVVRESVHPATLTRFLRDHLARIASSGWWPALEPCVARRERVYVSVKPVRATRHR